MGKKITNDIIAKIEPEGIDLSGEQGEYRTAIIDGAIFSSRIGLEGRKQVWRDGCWFLDI